MRREGLGEPRLLGLAVGDLGLDGGLEALRLRHRFEQARRFGRLLMMAATAMLLFLVAAIVHGDLKVTT